MGNQHARRMAAVAMGEGSQGGNSRDEQMGSVSVPAEPVPIPPNLSYGPQIPMVPNAPSPLQSVENYGAVPPDLSGLPEPSTLVPVAISWTQGGSVVEVEGSFDNWQSRQALHRSGNREFAIVKMLPPGVYQYKFIVDGEWKYAPDQPAMYDEMGNVNNVLEVQEYVPEILDSLDSFLAPSSPPESYNNALFTADDFAKEPPTCPPHLQLTLLNVPLIPDAPNLLPRPQHVVLNHMYTDKSKMMRGVQVLGTTHRYRSKYVTVVFVKPS